MSKCAECGLNEGIAPIQWQSVEETELYCEECASNG